MHQERVKTEMDAVNESGQSETKAEKASANEGWLAGPFLLAAKPFPTATAIPPFVAGAAPVDPAAVAAVPDCEVSKDPTPAAVPVPLPPSLLCA